MRWERGGWAEKQSREVKAPASQGSNKGKEQGKGDTFFTVINEWKIFGTFALDKIAWFSLVCVLQYFQLDLRWCQSVGWWYSTVLDDTALCWMIRHCVGWYGTVLDDTALCWMIRHCVEWYDTVLDDTALCWMKRHCVGWYGTVLNDTALCWMIRHCVGWYGTVLNDTTLCWMIRHMSLSTNFQTVRCLTHVLR